MLYLSHNTSPSAPLSRTTALSLLDVTSHVPISTWQRCFASKGLSGLRATHSVLRNLADDLLQEVEISLSTDADSNQQCARFVVSRLTQLETLSLAPSQELLQMTATDADWQHETEERPDGVPRSVRIWCGQQTSASYLDAFLNQLHGQMRPNGQGIKHVRLFRWKLNRKTMQAIADHLPELAELTIEACASCDAQLFRPLQHCNKLRSVSITDQQHGKGRHITSCALASLQRLAALTSLVISDLNFKFRRWGSCLTPKDLLLAQKLQQLRHLTLDVWLEHRDKEAAVQILGTLTSLHSLCAGFVTGSEASLVMTLPQLQVLQLQHASLSLNAICALSESCPNMKQTEVKTILCSDGSDDDGTKLDVIPIPTITCLSLTGHDYIYRSFRLLPCFSNLQTLVLPELRLVIGRQFDSQKHNLEALNSVPHVRCACVHIVAYCHSTELAAHLSTLPRLGWCNHACFDSSRVFPLEIDWLNESVLHELTRCCPNVSKLKIKGFVFDSASDPDMACKCLAPLNAMPLQSLTLESCFSVSEEAMRTFSGMHPASFLEVRKINHYTPHVEEYVFSQAERKAAQHLILLTPNAGVIGAPGTAAPA